MSEPIDNARIAEILGSATAPVKQGIPLPDQYLQSMRAADPEFQPRLARVAELEAERDELRRRVAELEAERDRLRAENEAMTDLGPPWLPELRAALGWQGGTIHDALQAVRRLATPPPLPDDYEPIDAEWPPYAEVLAERDTARAETAALRRVAEVGLALWRDRDVAQTDQAGCCRLYNAWRDLGESLAALDALPTAGKELST